MRRWVKTLLLALAVLLVLLVAVPVGFLQWANGESGHQAMERLVAKETDGMVKVTGLGGHFPDSLRISHAEIADSQGMWATVDGLALDWSPLVLLSGGASIQLLSADHVEILRQPVEENASSSSSSDGGIDLPVRVSLEKLRIAKLDLDQAVVGAPASLAITGTADVPSPARANARLSVQQLDGEGQYGIEGGYGRGGADLEITASEPARGLLARLAELPDLGALHLTASLKGPARDETLDLHLQAGDLRAQAQGKIDIADRRLDVSIALTAPAMTPRPDLSWKSAKLDTRLQGPFDRPEAEGHLTVEGITSAAAALDRVEADLQGKDGRLDIAARLFHLQTTGLSPELLGATPIELKAAIRLDVTPMPIEFSLAHPLLRMTGTASLSDKPDVSADIAVPDLAPFSTLAGTKLHGRAALTAKLSGGAAISIDGKVLEGDTEKLRLSADGHIGGKLDLRWSLATPDLARFGAPMAGSLSAKGTLRGPATDFQATATAEGRLQFPGMPEGPVSLSVEASGLPGKPSGKIEAHGQLGGAPLLLSAKVERAKDGALRIAIDQAHWKSGEASGTLLLDPGTGKASGKVQAKMTDLGDLAPLAGLPLKGSAEAGLDMVDAGRAPQARIHAEAVQLDWGDGRLDHAGLDGTIDDPLAHPVAALTLALDGIDASGVTGKASLQAAGPSAALKVHTVGRSRHRVRAGKSGGRGTGGSRQEHLAAVLSTSTVFRAADSVAGAGQPGLRRADPHRAAAARCRLGRARHRWSGCSCLGPRHHAQEWRSRPGRRQGQRGSGSPSARRSSGALG